MTRVQKAVQDYIAMRRSLGYKLHEAGVLLADFAAFLHRKRAATITIPLALAWARRDPLGRPAEWARRLAAVRCFARHWSATDPRTEIPPWGLLPHRPKRARPYLYSDEEVLHLLEAAGHLPGLGALTYPCLFGLLAVTGMRIGELLHLQTADVNLPDGVLTIHGAKFGKSRLVPLHRSTCTVLARYLQERDRLFDRPLEFFFVSRRGNRLDGGQVHRTFYTLSRRTGLRGPTERHGPRLHDFRHRMAVRTLVAWYRAGDDVERRLPVLSTYLGHVHVSDTYWYLTGCPELMGLAVKRLERHWEGHA